jgi:TPR repeat protein
MAAHYHKLAADQDWAEGQFAYAMDLELGFGVAADPKRAVDLYDKAAKRGHFLSMTRLGLCCEFGQLMRRDLPRAVQYYRSAAEAGDFVAQFQLGFCLEHGLGVERDPHRALDFCLQSLLSSEPDALSAFQCSLIYQYDLGQDVDLD